MTEITNREIKAYRYRTDTIGGVVKPRVTDGYYLDTRSYKLVVRQPTPDYRKRVALGLRLPVNAYTLNRENVKFPDGNSHLVLTYIPNGDMSVYDGPDASGFGSTSYLQPTLQQRNAALARCQNRVLEKIKNQKVNLGNFFAERDRCFKMISGTARTLAKSFTAVKRGNLALAAKLLATDLKPSVAKRRTVANRWLELQYGWRPLLSDVYGTVESLANILYRIDPPVMFASASTVLRDSDKLNPFDVAYVNREYCWKFRYGIYYTVDVQASYWLGNLGLTNPASILWEVIPYSFVVDWFAPVGNYLNLLDATLGVKFVDGFQSGLLDSTMALNRVGVFNSGNFRYNYNSHGLASWMALERAPVASFPMASLPQVKNPLSATHVANALALLTQAFVKR